MRYALCATQVFKRLQPQRFELMQLKRQQHLIEREVSGVIMKI
jgi:hypothetical protein